RSPSWNPAQGGRCGYVGHRVGPVRGDAGVGTMMSETDSADFGVETIEGDQPGVIIAVHGQADLHTAPQLREAMTTAIDRRGTSLIGDLCDATFVHSPPPVSSSSPQRPSSTR